MVEGLILRRTNVLRERLPPLFGVVEYRVYIEDDAAKREDPVANDLSNAKFCEASVHNVRMIHSSSDWNMNVPAHRGFTRLRLPVVERAC